jgi:succinylglutamate desuccinylase/aspartoacylase family protein
MLRHSLFVGPDRGKRRAWAPSFRVAEWGVQFADYAARWRGSVPPPAEAFTYGAVTEAGRRYPLLGLRVPGRHTVLVTAGFHGDETAGPETLLEHTAEIVAYAAARGVGLRIYPCVNPSGYEAHTRYNQSGERPNNDFLRYEVAPGVWRGEIATGQPFLRAVPAHDGMPKETAALSAELDGDPIPFAALDLHQDNFIPGAKFYAYVFGDLGPYRPLAARSGALVSVLAGSVVDSGYAPGTEIRSDAEGFIVCHDGSITDKFHRAGARLTAAIETTTQTPWALADEVNLIWIRGFIDLAAAEADPTPGGWHPLVKPRGLR